MYDPHGKYMRFAFQDICYQYHVLPFGLSLSLRDFVVHETSSRPTDEAGHPLQHLSGRLAAFGTVGAGGQSTPTYSPTQLGFVMIVEKSMLTPAQRIFFLGLSLNSLTFTVRLSVE